MESKYVRYQAGMPNGRGRQPGIFNLANGLARDGRLSSQDWASWRRSNDHYDSAYLNPSTVDKSIYDHAINPTAEAWFKCTAGHLLVRVEFYTDLLSRYAVEWQVLHSNDPGRLLYEDGVQIIVAPHEMGE
ncbi:hypothetical protein [Arthrobacter sp. 4R501]|uniref:hypothetical protein n=1 Tax=Arthrobacter sp. 4R501 TaxID=2058886 RepID=UPI000CE32B52|nr:hypothetical protein [Arthrobacter sp. 4R501]